jgi:hypothetical protein
MNFRRTLLEIRCLLGQGGAGASACQLFGVVFRTRPRFAPGFPAHFAGNSLSVPGLPPVFRRTLPEIRCLSPVCPAP